MAEEKRITISKTLNGDTIYYIARNVSGTIFARELTLKELQAAIKTYKEPPPIKEKEEEIIETATPEESTKEPTEEEGERQFLQNELKTKVQERKEQSKKKSFWDRLK